LHPEVHSGGMSDPRGVVKPIWMLSSRLTDRFAYCITDEVFARTWLNGHESIEMIRFKLAFQGLEHGSSGIGD
jgi:hypothetical protein